MDLLTGRLDLGWETTGGVDRAPPAHSNPDSSPQAKARTHTYAVLSAPEAAGVSDALCLSNNQFWSESASAEWGLLEDLNCLT